MGELWGVFCEYFEEKWPCYKGALLYISRCIWCVSCITLIYPMSTCMYHDSPYAFIYLKLWVICQPSESISRACCEQIVFLQNICSFDPPPLHILSCSFLYYAVYMPDFILQIIFLFPVYPYLPSVALCSPDVCILTHWQLVTLFPENKVNTVAVDDLTTFVARSSAAMVLTI